VRLERLNASMIKQKKNKKKQGFQLRGDRILDRAILRISLEVCVGVEGMASPRRGKFFLVCRETHKPPINRHIFVSPWYE